MAWILAEEEHMRGSTDPFVARTVLQAGRIVPLYELGEDNEQSIMLVLDKLRRHLHECDDIAQRIGLTMIGRASGRHYLIFSGKHRLKLTSPQPTTLA